MKFKYLASALSASALLVACGGGSDGPRSVDITPPPAVSPATITSVTRVAPPGGSVDVLRYGSTVAFLVTGTKLTSGVTLASTGCTSAATVDGATDTALTMTCVPTLSGAVSVTFAPTNGAVQATVPLTIPVPQVTMTTTMGTMVFELYPNVAPITVANFVQYVRREFYTAKIFHRVINNFVVQAGGYDSSLTPATALYPAIALEVGKGLSNVKGTLAMARTSDSTATATSQFYINVADNTNLDTLNGGYAVFGKVISGMEVANAIQVVPTKTATDTASTSLTDVPVTPIVITNATQTQ